MMARKPDFPAGTIISGALLARGTLALGSPHLLLATIRRA
jgi:hypothetical protein